MATTFEKPTPKPKKTDQQLRDEQRSKPQTQSTSRRFKGKLVEGIRAK
jgi:hypothetical protein